MGGLTGLICFVFVMRGPCQSLVMKAIAARKSCDVRFGLNLTVK